MMATLRKRHVQALGAYAIAFSQIFFIVGCRQDRGGAKQVAPNSTAAGATNIDMGALVYDMLHHQYEAGGEQAKADVLESRKDAFIGAVNRILPSDSAQNLIPTVLGLLPLVDDGTVEAAVGDVDLILADLIDDPATLQALAGILGATSTASSPRDEAAQRAQLVLISRLLAYPELDSLAVSIFALINENDGVDDQGNPNGEPNVLIKLQAMLSQALTNYQAAPGTAQGLAQTLEQLSAALLADNPLPAYPDMGQPAWAVRLDVHGNPAVLADAASGLLPVPFVDADLDGAADVNLSNQPVDAAGTPIQILPFDSEGTRDVYGRAIAPGGGLYYQYFDAKRTLLSEILLLAGELLKVDSLGNAVTILDALGDRVVNDNGTPADPTDDFQTLSPDTPLLDLTYASFELMKRTPLPGLLAGLGALIRQDPAKFGEMVDTLIVALKTASQAAATVPATGNGQALINDLLPLLEDTLTPQGTNGESAVRALLEAFNTSQAQLQTLPQSFALMMKFSDYGQRIPADANNKSIMQQLLEMMERADQCAAIGGSGTMADFYLDSMAGNQQLLGINISIGTIHNLLDIAFIRNLLCSQIQPADVRALQQFNDTGALDAMKPIAKVFSDRGQTRLLTEIMLGLGKHYDGVMRPTEPSVVAILESGAVEQLFVVIDGMTRVPVPGAPGMVVADAMAGTLQAMVNTTTPVLDRHGNQYPSLLTLMLAPVQQLQVAADARGVALEFKNLTDGLFSVLLATYVDDNGTPGDSTDDRERWKWQGLKTYLGEVLALASQTVPADPVARAQWADGQQASLEQALAGPEVLVIVDVLKVIAASPHKAVINRGIANLFTPSTNPAEDVYGSIVLLLADALSHKPQAAQAVATISDQALATVIQFVGRQLDPRLNRFSNIGRLLSRILGADNGLFLLHLARNAFNMGPNGTDIPPFVILQKIMAEVSAAGSQSAPMTADELKAVLEAARDFIHDADNGLPPLLARIKNRRK
jgi:hypothetical protein